MSGWNDLGAMLTGGVAREAEAQYPVQLRRNYDAYSALEEAKTKRSINMARDSLPASMERLGYKQELAQIMLGNQTMSMAQLGNAQNPNFYKGHEAAWNASGLDGGTQDLGNVNLGEQLASGKVVQYQKPMTANTYTTNAYDNDAEIKTTPLGESVIGLNQAKTGVEGAKVGATQALGTQRIASANLSDDKRINPEKHRAPAKVSKPKGKYELYKTVGGKKYGKDKKGDWYLADE